MEATITTIGDIFKKKITDYADETVLNAYCNAPTIWVDLDGNEHEDYEHKYIASSISSIDWPAADGSHDTFAPKVKSVVEKSRFSGLDDVDVLLVEGAIKQVGSHVIYCNTVRDSRIKSSIPYIYDISQVLKYAVNLESAVSTFEWIGSNSRDISFTEIPEDLFWNCPKLKNAVRTFQDTEIKNIPELLFSKNPKLEDVSFAFYSTPVGAEDIPANLFKNNHNLKRMSGLFFSTIVDKFPKEMLTPLMDDIISGNIDVESMFGNTRMARFFYDATIVKTERTKKARRDKFFPDYIPREILWQFIRGISDRGKTNF